MRESRPAEQKSRVPSSSSWVEAVVAAAVAPLAGGGTKFYYKSDGAWKAM